MEAVSTCGQPAVNPAHPTPPSRPVFIWESPWGVGGGGEGSAEGGTGPLCRIPCVPSRRTSSIMQSRKKHSRENTMFFNCR